jgi:hypothetical protein
VGTQSHIPGGSYGSIAFGKRPEQAKRTALWANPYGFSEWFKAMTPAETAFGRFFEGRSLEYARARLAVRVDRRAG